MLFHSNPKFQRDNELLIFPNGQEIEQVSCFKYLGIHMDPYLSFDNHVDVITRIVKQRTRLLWKMRSFIDTNLALDLYTSLIEPLFLYCCHLYEGTSMTNSNCLHVLQNNTLRAVMKVDNRFSATVYFHRLPHTALLLWQFVLKAMTNIFNFRHVSKGKEALSNRLFTNYLAKYHDNGV